jgi:Asp-tRNA(Asn)/Glu-tRNA(Gln) amidotransferase A subunit family amidase
VPRDRFETAVAQRADLDAGRVTSAELVEQSLARAEAARSLNAFTHLQPAAVARSPLVTRRR